jgi:serine/threonine protein kinase
LRGVRYTFRDPNCRLTNSGVAFQGNIFVDEEWGVRIADFGLSVFSDATIESSSGNSRGTLRWMAPELHFPKHFGLDGFKQTHASDIYAFVCTCLEVSSQIWSAITAKTVCFHQIYTLSSPFSHIRNEMGVVTEVVRGGRPSRPEAGSRCVISDVVWDVIETCWSQQSTDRPNAGEVVEKLVGNFHDSGHSLY